VVLKAGKLFAFESSFYASTNMLLVKLNSTFWHSVW